MWRHTHTQTHTCIHIRMCTHTRTGQCSQIHASICSELGELWGNPQMQYGVPPTWRCMSCTCPHLFNLSESCHALAMVSSCFPMTHATLAWFPQDCSDGQHHKVRALPWVLGHWVRLSPGASPHFYFQQQDLSLCASLSLSLTSLSSCYGFNLSASI